MSGALSAPGERSPILKPEIGKASDKTSSAKERVARAYTKQWGETYEWGETYKLAQEAETRKGDLEDDPTENRNADSERTENERIIDIINEILAVASGALNLMKELREMQQKRSRNAEASHEVSLDTVPAILAKEKLKIKIAIQLTESLKRMNYIDGEKNKTKGTNSAESKLFFYKKPYFIFREINLQKLIEAGEEILSKNKGLKSYEERKLEDLYIPHLQNRRIEDIFEDAQSLLKEIISEFHPSQDTFHFSLNDIEKNLKQIKIEFLKKEKEELAQQLATMMGMINEEKVSRRAIEGKISSLEDKLESLGINDIKKEITFDKKILSLEKKIKAIEQKPSPSEEDKQILPLFKELLENRVAINKEPVHNAKSLLDSMDVLRKEINSTQEELTKTETSLLYNPVMYSLTSEELLLELEYLKEKLAEEKTRGTSESGVLVLENEIEQIKKQTISQYLQEGISIKELERRNAGDPALKELTKKHESLQTQIYTLYRRGDQSPPPILLSDEDEEVYEEAYKNRKRYPLEILRTLQEKQARDEKKLGGLVERMPDQQRQPEIKPAITQEGYISKLPSQSNAIPDSRPPETTLATIESTIATVPPHTIMQEKNPTPEKVRPTPRYQYHDFDDKPETSPVRRRDKPATQKAANGNQKLPHQIPTTPNVSQVPKKPQTFFEKARQIANDKGFLAAAGLLVGSILLGKEFQDQYDVRLEKERVEEIAKEHEFIGSLGEGIDGQPTQTTQEISSEIKNSLPPTAKKFTQNTETYTVQNKDASRGLWGIAESMLQEATGNKETPPITPALVAAIKSANPEIFRNNPNSIIHPDDILNVSQAKELAKKYASIYSEDPIINPAYFGNESLAPGYTYASQQEQLAKQQASEKESTTSPLGFYPETNGVHLALLLPALQQGETPSLRAHRILEEAGLSGRQHTRAKDVLLAAVMLADSNKNASDALKLKHRGEKGYNAEKDNLGMRRITETVNTLLKGKNPRSIAESLGPKVLKIYDQLMKN